MSRPATRISPPADFYQADAYCAEESVGYLMKRIMMSVVYQVDKRLDVHELTSAQWGPLMRLQKEGASTVAELARWFSVPEVVELNLFCALMLAGGRMTQAQRAYEA